MLEDDYFLWNTDNLKDLIDCLLVIEHPAVQPEEDDHVHVKDVMVNLEFPQQGQFFLHHFIQNVWKILNALHYAEGDPNMLVLVPLDRKPVPKQ